MEKVARPFRVCLTGCESTGKTELARRLAAHFSAPWVPEFSRDYAQMMARPLSYMDVTPIGRGQLDLESRVAADARHLLILDTDLLSTVVYSRHHFGVAPEWIERNALSRRADLYLLLDVDVPWVADAVRDGGDARRQLHRDFRRVLEEYEAEYVVIAGSWEERFGRAVEAIEAAKRNVEFRISNSE